MHADYRSRVVKVDYSAAVLHSTQPFGFQQLLTLLIYLRLELPTNVRPQRHNRWRRQTTIIGFLTTLSGGCYCWQPSTVLQELMSLTHSSDRARPESRSHMIAMVLMSPDAIHGVIVYRLSLHPCPIGYWQAREILISVFCFKWSVERIFFFASFKMPLFNEYEVVFIIA